MDNIHENWECVECSRGLAWDNFMASDQASEETAKHPIQDSAPSAENS